jgi:predicted nucleic acid-binding protein
MAYLVETPILMRLANFSDANYFTANAAVETLQEHGETLHIAPQNLIEFRNGATRSQEINGLGLSLTEADAKADIFEAAFSLLPETPDIYPAWKALVRAAGVTGKQVHDVRLVAICQVYSITHILTFNVRHFARMAAFVPGLTVVTPQNI